MPEKDSCSLRIRQVLRSECGRPFFGDRPPRWREGRYGNPPKSASWAAHERRLLVNALRRDGGQEALALARLMNHCELGRPSLSGACPICMRAFHRMFVHATLNLYDDHNRDMRVINIVSAKRAIRYGRLHRHDLFRGIRKRLVEALEYVGLPALGGFDVSGNEHEAHTFGPHWMPHAWIELALALDRAGLDARLFLRGYELVASHGDVEIVRSSRARERLCACIERGDDGRPRP
jgi:hypothetical protein